MDASYWPDSFSDDRRKAIERLTRGREFATELRYILGRPAGDPTSAAAAKGLVRSILDSFTEGISLLSRSAYEVSQLPAGSQCGNGVKSEDSDESSKTSVLNHRRGCYKRRRISQTYSRVTPNLIDDGYAWRKYGQKVILNSKHPRNYFRCTHKFDQGCQATKQVQKLDDEPPMYRTTYYGQHTCKNLLKPPQIIIDSSPPKDSAFILSFSGNPNTKSQDPIFPSFPLVKEETKEDCKPILNNESQSSPLDYLLSPELTAYDSCGPMTVLSSGSDHGDVISSGVYSCTASTHSAGLDDIDIVVGTVGFDDDVLQFEF
ncbi:hypothetical protein NMG60_11035914 [Bertholletia excelsa]